MIEFSEKQLKEALEEYEKNFPLESNSVRKALNLLRFGQMAFCRSSREAHFTASCWLVNFEMDKVLLLLHRKLNDWLQPGGHADGDVNLVRVAAKELAEETSCTGADFLQQTEDRVGIFDLGIHQIPANDTVPAHFHYDIRFLCRAPKSYVPEGNHESHEIKWIPFAEVSSYNPEESLVRMVEKFSDWKMKVSRSSKQADSVQNLS